MAASNFDFDILGRLITKSDPNGNELRFSYDRSGNPIRIDRKEVTRDVTTNAVVGTRYFAETFVYDELNRLAEERTPIGSAKYSYDSRGNLVEIEDPLANKIKNNFDIFSRLTENVEELHKYDSNDIHVPVRIAFSYDLDDQKTSQTDAQGRITTFRYDSAGRLVSTILPDGSSDSIQYDRVGNIIEYKDWRGIVRKLEWDELNRNVKLQIHDSEAPGDLELEGATVYRSEYDALGGFKIVENDFVLNSLKHNSLNHLVEEVVSFKAITGIDPANQYTIKREFNDSGALVSLTYPSGRRIAYSRDVLDRVTKLEQVQKGNSYPGDPATSDNLTIARLEYEGTQLKRISRHNGVSTEYKYDFGGRIVEIAHTKDLNNVLTLQFLYDALGNMRQKIEVSEDYQSMQGFRYDSLSRLFEAKKSATASLLDLSPLSPPSLPLPESLPDLQSQISQLISNVNDQDATIIEYDLVGNRQSKVVGGSSEDYEINSLDQYRKVNTKSFQYDKNGNLIKDDAFLYFYDYRNQLSKVKRIADDKETEFYFD
jgi:YD repeat-containing protein